MMQVEAVVPVVGATQYCGRLVVELVLQRCQDSVRLLQLQVFVQAPLKLTRQTSAKVLLVIFCLCQQVVADSALPGEPC